MKAILKSACPLLLTLLLSTAPTPIRAKGGVPFYNVEPFSSNDNQRSISTESTTRPSKIILGEAFWPPSMLVIAWIQNENWCYEAVEVPDNKLFATNGLDALSISLNDYWGSNGTLVMKREGKPFADCKITPESVRMGACPRETRITGPITRRWTCWVLDGLLEKDEEEVVGRKLSLQEKLKEAAEMGKDSKHADWEGYDNIGKAATTEEGAEGASKTAIHTSSKTEYTAPAKKT